MEQGKALVVIGWKPLFNIGYSKSDLPRYLYSICIIYEGHSINKLQNSAIPSVLKTDKSEIYVLFLNIHTTFLSDDVIIVTSSDNTVDLCVIFSISYYRNSQVINNIRTTEFCC